MRPAETAYRERCQTCAVEIDRLSVHDRRLTYGRAVLFGAALILGLMAWSDPDHRTLWSLAAGLAAVSFLVVITIHDRVTQQLVRLRLQTTINTQWIARLHRRWTDFPHTQVTVPSEHEAVAQDLDLFGPRSLFHFLCQAHTPLGIRMLRDWLLSPAEPDRVVGRQEAVRVLAADRELREELTLRGRMLADALAGPEAFVRWAEGPHWLDQRRWLTWASRILPAAVVIVTVLTLTNVLSPQIGGLIILVGLLGNGAISVLFTGSLHDVFDQISSKNGELRHYRALFDVTNRLPDSTEDIRRIRHLVADHEIGPQHQLKQLDRIMDAAGLRHASLLSLLYFALQIAVLWDFHVAWFLERWQQRNRSRVRDWFMAIGELEALSSLALVHYDYPEWTFAELSNSESQFVAEQLGHPLLPDDERVANDASAGPPGTVLLVTGSNMSGKSTLLRAIGINALLAQAGSPACARGLRMPTLVVTTSMRITDSLAAGTSFYMAELKRLKQIVDQACGFSPGQGRMLLYLLDEILQGTNSAERHIAVTRVIAHLIEQHAIGAVSTHDLELAGAAELRDACQPVHFRETFETDADGKRQMRFDYRMQPGVATTTNALKLLEIVGLE